MVGIRYFWGDFAFGSALSYFKAKVWFLGEVLKNRVGFYPIRYLRKYLVIKLNIHFQGKISLLYK